jgi:hypothetical protein
VVFQAAAEAAKKKKGDIDPQVVELAKKGIKALIESTRAFHGLGDKRPIITNVFGTAHACVLPPTNCLHFKLTTF